MQAQSTHNNPSAQEDQTNPFQEAFQTSKDALKECQKQNQLSSCLPCPKVLECATRSDYVKHVYLFLNRGQSESDFDF